MVIHVGGADEAAASNVIQQLVDKRYGRELRLGRQLIGWNLSDTIVLRGDALSYPQLQRYVSHFAPQRHVVFNHVFPPAHANEYVTFAHDVHDYVFAFLDYPLDLTHTRLREQFRSARCDVVTLRLPRGLQQLEALLLSAQTVLGSYEPLTLPRRCVRRTTRSTAKNQTAA